MNRLGLFFTFFLLVFHVEAESNKFSDDSSSQESVPNFKPSLAVVIGILCVTFSLTFFLLIYAKFCHRGSSIFGFQLNEPALVRSASQFSGIDKAVIESLPFFKFSSLKGSKQGLECAVCLSKFEDIEILRLLPKCKHAFHINCIDQWLEKHSSCPLCRFKVNPEDPTIFTYSNSMRLLFSNSEVRADSNIELLVQREEDHRGSSRFSIGSSFRKKNKEPNKEEQVLIQDEIVDEEDNQKILHKYNHKIVVSDVIFKNRWSNASSSDLMFLNSELLNDRSSNRFSAPNEIISHFPTTKAIKNGQIMKIKEEMEMKRSFENKVSTISKTNGGLSVPDNIASASNPKKLNSSHTSRTIDPGGRRSVSEITSFSRFQDLRMKNRIRDSSTGGNERMKTLWMPIARRTVQWFADRERTSQQHSQNTTRPSLDV